VQEPKPPVTGSYKFSQGNSEVRGFGHGIFNVFEAVIFGAVQVFLVNTQSGQLINRIHQYLSGTVNAFIFWHFQFKIGHTRIVEGKTETRNLGSHFCIHQFFIK